MQLGLVARTGASKVRQICQNISTKNNKKAAKNHQKNSKKARKTCDTCTHKSHEKDGKKQQKNDKKIPQSTLKKRFQIMTKLRQEATSHQQFSLRTKIRDPQTRENMRQRSARKAAQKYEKT